MRSVKRMKGRDPLPSGGEESFPRVARLPFQTKVGTGIGKGETAKIPPDGKVNEISLWGGRERRSKS